MSKAKTKKFLSALLCTIICISASFTALAASNDAAITVSSVSAMPGDTVVIDVEISNNPGIMAMAFCITYDSDALTYTDYEKGYLSSYTIKDHSEKGHISVVNVENTDKSNNGKIISVVFEVKENAKPGKHVIGIANSNRDKYGTKLHNSFSNSKQQFVVPLVTAGGVTVQETCENSGHKYGDWNIINAANCTETGLKNRTCARCQIVDEVAIPITHDFEAEWTVDKAATPDEDGIMSRHCKLCDAVTDKITFCYEEIGGGDEDDTSIGNTSSDSTSSGNASNDNTSNEASSENSSTNVGSDTDISEDTSSDNQSDTQSQTGIQNNGSQTEIKPTQKPIINNVVGEKVPLSEVEKFEDYQQNIKPSLENNSSNEEITSSEVNSSKIETDNSDVTTGVTQNNSDTDSQNKEPSFFTTPTGIIMIVICLLISIGIITLGIVLIVRRKREE